MPKTAKRVSALDGVYQEGPFGAEIDPPGVTILERRGLTLVHVESLEDDTATIAALSAALGFELPNIRQCHDANTRRAIWLGPARWLVVGRDTDYGATAKMLTDAAPDAAINDVSSSRTVLRLGGTAVRDTLAQGCTVDLHPLKFKPNMTATTDIDHVVVTLDCLDVEMFDVYVPRGFAVSFWEWLVEQAQEYGGDVKAAV